MAPGSNVAFHAQFPDKPFIVRVTPDAFTESLKQALEKILSIVDETTNRIKERMG